MNRGHIEGSPDERQHAERAGQNTSVRLTLPVSARELVVAIICAVSILTSLALWSKLHDADKDIQTQIWLRSDSLTKENADLKGHITAAEALIQAYGLNKTCKER